jgi:hypothetical protein
MTMVLPEAAPVDNPAGPLPEWYPKWHGKPFYNGNPEVSTIIILYLFSKDSTTVVSTHLLFSACFSLKGTSVAL